MLSPGIWSEIAHGLHHAATDNCEFENAVCIPIRFHGCNEVTMEYATPQSRPEFAADSLLLISGRVKSGFKSLSEK
jgi:hypothetical protein